MKQIITFLLFLLLPGWFSSCQKLPNGGIPIYLAMDYGQVKGGAWPNDTTAFISDVWVQTTSNNLGAYQLPCNFPVLENSNISFLVNAGIWESGQQEVRVEYPFYQPDTFTLKNAVPGQKYFHHPAFKYKGAAIFSCPDNFETELVYDSMTFLNAPDTNVKYGTRCGVITATRTDSDVIAMVSKPYLSQYNFYVAYGNEVWLELDYKADIPFWVGLSGIFSSGGSTQQQILFMLPTGTWKKEYIKLTNVLAGMGASSYTPYFEAIDTVGGSGGRVYLDNIKIVHY